MGCGKDIKLPGGFRYRVTRLRRSRTCFYCRKPISALAEAVVEERFRVDRRYYHLKCFAAEFGYRFAVRQGPDGSVICVQS